MPRFRDLTNQVARINDIHGMTMPSSPNPNPVPISLWSWPRRTREDKVHGLRIRLFLPNSYCWIVDGRDFCFSPYNSSSKLISYLRGKELTFRTHLDYLSTHELAYKNVALISHPFRRPLSIVMHQVIFSRTPRFSCLSSTHHVRHARIREGDLDVSQMGACFLPFEADWSTLMSRLHVVHLWTDRSSLARSAIFNCGRGFY